MQPSTPSTPSTPGNLAVLAVFRLVETCSHPHLLHLATWLFLLAFALLKHAAIHTCRTCEAHHTNALAVPALHCAPQPLQHVALALVAAPLSCSLYTPLPSPVHTAHTCEAHHTNALAVPALHCAPQPSGIQCRSRPLNPNTKS